VEHDDWFADNRWAHFIELIAYCQTQVDTYNLTHEPIVFGVDIPPHFLTGPDSSGQVKSNWDVMNIVDTITLMDYRDFADLRWDGRTHGIIPLKCGPSARLYTRNMLAEVAGPSLAQTATGEYHPCRAVKGCRREG
jgi:hypothetical protein